MHSERGHDYSQVGFNIIWRLGFPLREPYSQIQYKRTTNHKGDVETHKEDC